LLQRRKGLRGHAAAESERRHGKARRDHAKAGQSGAPRARRAPFAASAAKTLRKDREPPLIIDGPFAETKEQLLGFYIVACDSMEEALEIARELGSATPAGCYEIRPLMSFSGGAVSGA
jgi:hypothetical protein